MKNVFLLILCIMVLQACDSDDKQSHPGDASQIAFSVKDTQGNDLLDLNHSNYLSKDSIKIYDTDGVLIDYPIQTFKDERPEVNAFVYSITYFCNEQEMENLYCKRYWHWNSTHVDTIEVFLKNYDNYRIDSYKFKVNGVEFNLENMPTRIIQLVKQ
ncbi:MAG: hypothetical protein Q4G18_07335 [Myroides sp.]|nr:hypothetical protein [Myroides sp.]